MKRGFFSVIFACAAIPVWAAGADAQGIPNFHQVNKNLFRGGQPTGEGWKHLAKLGVKTVIDLRRENEKGTHSIKAESRAVEAAGMRYVSIPMQGIVAPSEEQISKAMSLLESGEPVFVHCREGKDRTGTVIACYRIKNEGWQNHRALKEAKARGMHWVEIGMKSYISSYRAAQSTPASAPVADLMPATR